MNWPFEKFGFVFIPVFLFFLAAQDLNSEFFRFSDAKLETFLCLSGALMLSRTFWERRVVGAVLLLNYVGLLLRRFLMSGSVSFGWRVGFLEGVTICTTVIITYYDNLKYLRISVAQEYAI